MRMYDIPELKVETEETFAQGMTDKKLDKALEETEKELSKKMHENLLKEQESMQYAKKFHAFSILDQNESCRKMVLK